LSRRYWLAITLSWAIIVFECSFFLVFFIDLKYVMILLAMGVLFHLTNAIVMGLNGFLFAFTAAYPAVFYCVLTAQDLGIRFFSG